MRSHIDRPGRRWPRTTGRRRAERAGGTAASFRKARSLIGPGQGGRWLVVVALALLVSGIEAVGTVLVYLLLGLLVGEAGATSLPLVGDVTRLTGGLSQERLLMVVGSGIAVFFAVRSVCVLVMHYVQHRVVENGGARLSTRLLAGYLAMPAEFHLGRNSSELIRNAFESVRLFLDEGLIPGVKLVTKVAIVAGIVTVLLVTSPVPTAVAIGGLGLVAWVIMRFVQPRIKRLGRTSQAMSAQNIRVLQQSFEGWREITVLGRERAFIERYASDRRRLARARYLRRTAAQIPPVGLETAVILLVAGLLGLTVATDTGSPAQALPVLGLFAYASVRLLPELTQITTSLNAIKYVGPAIDDLYADLQVVSERPPTAAASGPALQLTDAIRLEAVRYRYPDTQADAVADMDLTIRRGESVGIVGPTGGGKSTLVDVILGLLEPVEGRVTVDGRDIRDHRRAWQANIGLVPQSMFLTDDTIRQNIALGIGEDDIDEERVLDVVARAQLTAFVRGLRDGLDTEVGERGLRISGGERQRLAIARALYCRPDVLIFDEGTSALDVETEAALMRSLATLHGRCTMITVAHRLSTVQACDQVLLVEGGRISDRGTYAELAQRHARMRVAVGAPGGHGDTT